MYIQFEDLIVNLYNKQRLEQTGSTSNPLHKPRRALSAEHHRHRGSVDCALILKSLTCQRDEYRNP